MKKALSLILAAVLALALGGTALAKVPDKPDTFAYFYDYDGSVLSSGDKQTIAEYGVDEKDFLATLDEMTENAFNDQCTPANPRYPLMSEIKQMYLNAYYGTKQ